MTFERLKTTKLVRVFIAEEDTYKGKPLYKYILQWCMENDIAGATVFKAFAGYGKHKKLRKHSLLPKKDLPIVVEIIDNPEKVEEKLLPFLKEVVREGLITSETVYILG
jgi:PII-like signaling protein